ncbi:MAG: hypothetical protein ABIT83_05990 [Massilia sp.]
MKKLFALVSLVIPMFAHAGAYTAHFTPTSIFVSGEGNYHFRVHGVPGCGSGWAYMNQADSGFKTYAAALMMAFTASKPVMLYVDTDTSGYCHIIEAQVFAS